MFRRHALAVFCSIPMIGLLAAGCSDDEKATPQAIFEGSLTRGGNSSCQDSRQLFTVGEFGTPALQESSKPKKDGDAEGQGTVNVACSVKSAGNGEFNVDATLALSGPVGGRFSVSGKFTPTGTQEGIKATFASRESGNTYEQADSTCTVVYDTSVQGVALGRVWGRISCPNATRSGSPDVACQADAQFRFENCAQ